MTLLHRLLRPTVTNKREFRLFVATVTLACVGIALTIDVVNQLVFFVDSATCFRSWAITIIVAAVLALPISWAIGKAHLALYQAKMLADKLSRTDQLTGLLNRRALLEAVPACNSVLALVITDIDRFKIVNDTYGHLAGDEVIRSVAQGMAVELSELGLLARIGGEEFALLCSGLPAQALMERLTFVRDRISATPIMVNGVPVHVTISAGVSIAERGEGFDQLYFAADHALYAAKAGGRNRIVLAEGTPATCDDTSPPSAQWPAAA